MITHCGRGQAGDIDRTDGGVQPEILLVQLIVQENIVAVARDPAGMYVSQLRIREGAECHRRALIGDIDDLKSAVPAKLNTTSQGLCPGAH